MYTINLFILIITKEINVNKGELETKSVLTSLSSLSQNKYTNSYAVLLEIPEITSF